MLLSILDSGVFQKDLRTWAEELVRDTAAQSNIIHQHGGGKYSCSCRPLSLNPCCVPDVVDLLIHLFFLFFFFFCCGWVSYVERLLCFVCYNCVLIVNISLFVVLPCADPKPAQGGYTENQLMHYGILLSHSPPLCSLTRLQSDSVCRWKHKNSLRAQLRCLDRSALWTWQFSIFKSANHQKLKLCSDSKWCKLQKKCDCS